MMVSNTREHLSRPLKEIYDMKNIMKSLFLLCIFMAQVTHAEPAKNPYEVHKEAFSVSKLKHGYNLADAKRLHNEWNLGKFLNITESGAYSYMHFPEFMHHGLIHRAGQVIELPYKENKAIGEVTLPLEGQKIRFTEMIMAEDSPVQGVIVVHKGKIVYQQYPGMRPSDRHVWMSNSKVVAGLIVAQLEEEGKIDVNKPIVDYLAKTQGTAWQNIKIIDALNMQTGLYLEENPATRSGNTPYNEFVRSEIGYPGRDGKVYTHDEALLKIPKLGPPGLKFEYSSAITQMLGLIIEEVEQKRLPEIVSERIWSKVGMAGDGVVALTPQGNAIIHGLISSRLDDMARFAMLFTPSQSVLTDSQIVTPSILEKMQTTGKTENYLQGTLGPLMAKNFRETPRFNAYQWDAVFADGDLFKSGMNGQGIYVSPSRDVSIVWFSTGFTPIPMYTFSRAIARSF